MASKREVMVEVLAATGVRASGATTCKGAAAAEFVCGAPDESRLAEAMAGHHAGLERAFSTLAVHAHGDDPMALRLEWARLEREILRHMEIEEEDLLPVFARDHAAEAAALRAQHDAIRALCAELGVALDLRLLRADRVDGMLAALHAHAEREEASLYPWAEQNLPVEAWRGLGEPVARLGTSRAGVLPA